MLIPKKVKHRKWQKGRARNIRIASTKIFLAFGEFGLKATTPVWLTSRQIEACRRVLTRYTRRGGKIWIRVFPDKPITKRGNEIRMGGGKGSVDHYVAPIRPGTILFEMDGIPADKAKEALEKAAYKLPCKAVYITRNF
ncbi:50S ribosomal protein L16 [Patescibacteria group bacterium]|nr:50S ribosomal protein L16 [Patescibacteria group bacterium]